jgi:hypothetical protein
MFNSRIASIVLYILLAIAVAVFVLFFVGGTTPETAGLLLQEPKFTTPALQLAYVYFGIAALLAVGFPIIGIIAHPKGTGGLLIGILMFIAVFVVSYFLASNEPIPNMVNKANVAGPIKFVDTGLIACYIFLFGAILGIVYTEIAGMLSK